MVVNQEEAPSKVRNKVAEPAMSATVVILYSNQVDGHYGVGESFERPVSDFPVLPQSSVNMISYVTDNSFIYLQPGLQEINRSDLKIIQDYMGEERFKKVIQVFEKRSDLPVSSYQDNLEDYDIDSIKAILMGCHNLERLESVSKGVTTKRLLTAIENRRKQLESDLRRRSLGGNQIVEAKSTIAPLVMSQRYDDSLGL